MADQQTAILQTQGGTQSAATGQANLAAARSGNVGGFDAAIDDAARSGGVQAQNAELGVQNQSDAIARANEAEGLSGLSNIYTDANGQANANLQAANQAAKPFWQQFLLQGMQSAGQAATGNLGK